MHNVQRVITATLKTMEEGGITCKQAFAITCRSMPGLAPGVYQLAEELLTSITKPPKRVSRNCLIP